MYLALCLWPADTLNSYYILNLTLLVRLGWKSGWEVDGQSKHVVQVVDVTLREVVVPSVVSQRDVKDALSKKKVAVKAEFC